MRSVIYAILGFVIGGIAAIAAVESLAPSLDPVAVLAASAIVAIVCAFAGIYAARAKSAHDRTGGVVQTPTYIAGIMILCAAAALAYIMLRG